MSRHQLLLIMALLIAGLGVGLRPATAPASPSGGQNPSAAPSTVIKAETNLVVVDVIATDKKGNYISDLEKQDFHVYEDDSEQPIVAFSHETETQPGVPGHERYMVLFFDDSTMDTGSQMRARQAAGKFVESTASPDRQMAVVDFGGTLRVAQNFTADGELLKRAVGSVKYSAINPNAGTTTVQLASIGTPSLGGMESDFAARSVLLSMRELAKSLRGVRGRKTLILFSGGFALDAERISELTATIDALNKANVAVYPVDVRGLAAPTVPGMDISNPAVSPGIRPPGADLLSPESPFVHLPGLLAALAAPPMPPDPQRGGGGGAGGIGGGGGVGGGGGGGGSHGGGSSGGSGGTSGSGSAGRGSGSTGSGSGTSGTRGGTSGNPSGSRGGSNYNNNYNQNLYNCGSGAGMLGNTTGCANRAIIPNIPTDVATNQQVLYALAKGTGGFEIFNTNDFLQGLQKIAKEMNEYYNLGYTPPSQRHDGSYHKIKVEATRKGVTVRYRTGYFDIKDPDLLKGTPEGKALEERVAGAEAGDIPVSLSAPYFYSEPGVARVNLALSVPGSTIDFEKQKNIFHSDVKVLGIAYRPDGSVAARFSDTMKLDYEKKTLKDFTKGSFDYQNTFNIAPGTYKLKLVLSAGSEKFGKYEVPLVVEPFSGTDLTVGGLAFGERFVPVSQFAANMDAALLEDHTPLIAKNMELVPSTSCRFAQGAAPVVYVEVFDPVLKKDVGRVEVGVLYDIINKSTNQQVYSSNTVLITEFVQPGNPLISAGLSLPIGQLPSGNYRLEMKARDAYGNASTSRTADFTVQ